MINATTLARVVKDRPTDISALDGPRTATKDLQRQSSTPNSDLQITCMALGSLLFERLIRTRGVKTVEQRLLGLYENHRDAFSPEHVHATMRYGYYIGETFRRACEGIWVTIPVSGAYLPAIDFPMRETMIKPTDLVTGAVNRRDGKHLALVFGHAERDYEEWLAAGKPERTFLGSLREG